MAKIGRNEPCPCGSGKKYKKCCIDKPVDLIPGYEGRRTIHWSPEEIRIYSTEQIIQKLRAFGIPFEKETFLEDVKGFYSASELAEHWTRIHPVTAQGFDEDFIWMAGIILWERLASEVVNSEMLDDKMQRGYELLDAREVTEACTLWLEVWDHLKTRFSVDMKGINDAESVFDGLQSLYNWCQDFEIELGNAGLDDKSFLERRIQYCNEFCSLFPETEELILVNMKRAVAESYFALGMIQQGEMAFEALVKEFPENPWGYISWGDAYSLDFWDHDHRDPEKAKRIYRTALERNIGEKKTLISRIEELQRKDNPV